MQLLQGISIGDVEFIASRGLNVRRGFPDGPLSEADGYAFSGKSQDTGLQPDATAHRRCRNVARVHLLCSTREETGGFAVRQGLALHLLSFVE